MSLLPKIDFKRSEERFTRSVRLLAVSAVALTVSGCVSGPGNYFESVSRESRANAKQSNQPVAQDLEIAAVESNDLAAPGQSNISASAEQPIAPSQTSIAQPESLTGVQSGSQNETLLASGQTGVPGEAGTPLQIGLVQAPDGNVLLLPKTLDPQAAPATDALQSAYAPPQGDMPLQDPALASLTPPAAAGPNALLQNSENGFSIGSQITPVVDPFEAAAEARIPLLYGSIKHGQCKQGFGPKPKKIGAKRINPGDPYYIEIRMRQTPLLPVGHTYVAYGKLGADGEPLDEKLIMLAPIGGYAGAALASGIPMPGILTPHRDDCRIRPDVGYRVSLNAQRYEKLLLEVRKAKAERPSYLLLAYNCNHFMTRIAGSVGILPPRNIYIPAVQYLYAMIERNEGIKVSRR